MKINYPMETKHLLLTKVNKQLNVKWPQNVY